jgi:hypothetical protein
MHVARNRAAGRFLAASSALIAGVALSGCVGLAPTYGTGTPADQQLVEDVTGMFSLAPKKREQIDYKPRPDLVKPDRQAAAAATLPPPQDNIVAASVNSAAWPESPEARRARIRADATARQDDPTFEPEVAMSTDKSRQGRRATKGDDVDINGNVISPLAQRSEFNRRLAENRQGSPTSRKYLSEPPLEYRVPAATAPVNDVGEDEWKKDRRRKAGHTKKSGSWIPWL